MHRHSYTSCFISSINFLEPFVDVVCRWAQTQYLDIWDQIREQIANHIRVELPTVSDNESILRPYLTFSPSIPQLYQHSKDLRMDFHPLKEATTPYWFDRLSLKSPLMSLKIRLWFYVYFASENSQKSKMGILNTVFPYVRS
jgi:hypothetical protein